MDLVHTMTTPTATPGGTVLMHGPEALLLGLVAGGSRLAFVAPSALEWDATGRGGAVALHERRLNAIGGAVLRCHSDREAVLMAAGAALAGARTALLTADSGAAHCHLNGIEPPVVIADLSGQLPLQRLCGHTIILAPHHARAAFEMGAAAPGLGEMHDTPVVLAGVTGQEGPVAVGTWDGAPHPPIHHDGPDDPDLLLVSAGASFHECSAVRDRLEAEGEQAAHLHLLQLRPFPAAIVAPALSSARKLLVVEPGAGGGPTLTGLIKEELCPTKYVHDLPGAAGVPLSADEIYIRAKEVLML